MQMGRERKQSEGGGERGELRGVNDREKENQRSTHAFN